MIIRTLLAQILQRFLELIQIISILATRPTANHNLLRERLRILWTQELRVVRQADVHEALDRMRDVGRRGVGRWRDGLHRRAHVLIVVVEWRVLDAVPVDLADIEILFHFRYVLGWDSVGCAPDSRRRRGMLMIL